MRASNLNFPVDGLKNLTRLEKHGFHPATLAALITFISQAAEHELYQANPRYWAERVGLDERTILTLIIAGVAEGLFDLSWQVTCPVCGILGHAQSLGQVSQVDRCAHLPEARLDEEVSVTVSVSENVRLLSPTTRVQLAFRAEVEARLGVVSSLALINTPVFRELITNQNLPEGQSLGVKQLTLFFSDLRGSTALYHKLGDIAAYQMVRRHFMAVFEAVTRHNGTAVKTLGDGIMGVFAHPLEAVQGIHKAMQSLEQINTELGLKGDDRLVLKVGLHTGPCIVVTLNGRLDYFGETVNIAARLSALAQGDDVIVSHAILDDPATCALAEGLGQLLPLNAQLHGLPETFELHRIVIAQLQESP